MLGRRNWPVCVQKKTNMHTRCNVASDMHGRHFLCLFHFTGVRVDFAGIVEQVQKLKGAETRLGRAKRAPFFVDGQFSLFHYQGKMYNVPI